MIRTKASDKDIIFIVYRTLNKLYFICTVEGTFANSIRESIPSFDNKINCRPLYKGKASAVGFMGTVQSGRDQVGGR